MVTVMCSQREESIYATVTPSEDFHCIFGIIELSLDYRVTLVVEYLGWVDLDLGCSTILLGQ